MLLPLLIFSGLIGKLGLLDRSGGLGSLEVISAVHCLLCLDLVRIGVSGSTFLENLYISLSHVET